LYAGIEAALESAIRITAAARRRSVPVVFTNVEYAPGGADGGVFFRKVPALKCFERGNPLGAFPARLAPQPHDVVITKRYASAFFGTHLAATLTALGIDTLIICGTSTSGCIRATALDACQNGFIPFVVGDACGDRHPGPHAANLFDLQAKYAEVVDEDEILRLIDSST
jgi:maleamate amidohydrolase